MAAVSKITNEEAFAKVETQIPIWKTIDRLIYENITRRIFMMVTSTEKKFDIKSIFL